MGGSVTARPPTFFKGKAFLMKKIQKLRRKAQRLPSGMQDIVFSKNKKNRGKSHGGTFGPASEVRKPHGNNQKQRIKTMSDACKKCGWDGEMQNDYIDMHRKELFEQDILIKKLVEALKLIETEIELARIESASPDVWKHINNADSISRAAIAKAEGKEE